MSQTEATTGQAARIVHKLGRLARFIVFLCTGGWAFPHVCTEDLDLRKIQDGHMAPGK
jgi:hypothetical protein